MAIPSKGRLVQPTIKLLEDVGIRLQVYDDRALMIPTNWPDLNIIRVRPEDIPYIVESAPLLWVLRGLDYVIESQSEVRVVERLGFGNGKIVVAVPNASDINGINDMEDGIRVATKYVNLTMNYFRAYGKNVRIVRISGSAEIMPLLGVAEAIVDVMSTGTTLKIHGLKPISVIMETEAVLITNNTGFDKCGEVMERFLLLLRGVKSSINKKLVLMNVPMEYLSKVLSILPAMEDPPWPTSRISRLRR